MARIIIAGDAMVVESAHTLETLKTLEKYRPKALTLSMVMVQVSEVPPRTTRKKLSLRWIFPLVLLTQKLMLRTPLV